MNDGEMARTQDLTLQLADGVLSERELDDLERLLESDPGAVRSYQGLLDLEASLRGLRQNIDLVDPAMARLHAILEEEITRGSMERIRSGPQPKWKTQSSSPREDCPARRTARLGPRLQIAAVALLAFAAAGALVLVLERSWRGPPLGSIVSSTPGVVVARGGAATEAAPGARLAADDSVQVPPGGMARIRCGAGIDLELGPATSLTLAAPPRQIGAHGEVGARFVVSDGAVTAKVSRELAAGPVVFATPHAEGSTASGEMVVSVRTASTVFEARKGQARIRRLSDGAAVNLEPGSFVLAAASVPLAARHIASARLHHPDRVPPDHNLPAPVAPHGHDQNLHPELKQQGGQRKNP